MKLIIVTGLSGAGKSQVIHVLEDIGYFCIDNIPPQLILKFAELHYHSSEKQQKTALVCDTRSGDIAELISNLDELEQNGYEYEILFLEASDETLIKRYKETRRSHPLSKDGRIVDGILLERKMLNGLRERAVHIIDTSMLKTNQLKEQIMKIYCDNPLTENLFINILSFGFKYGIPLDSDLVFDVRFLPNPFYDPKLRNHTGLEFCVSDFVMSHEQSQIFLDKLTSMIEYLIPFYIQEGKSQLVISIGCTGGHHRSVTIAESLYKNLHNLNHNAIITHRDIQKGI